MFSAIKNKSTALVSSRAEMDKYTAKLLILFSLICLGSCASENGILKNSSKGSTEVNTTATHAPILNKHSTDIKNTSEPLRKYSSDMEEFRDIMLEYVEDVLNRNKINIMPGVYIEKKASNATSHKIEKKSFEESLISTIKDFADTHILKVELARAMSETGRLFFFKGN